MFKLSSYAWRTLEILAILTYYSDNIVAAVSDNIRQIEPVISWQKPLRGGRRGGGVRFEPSPTNLLSFHIIFCFPKRGVGGVGGNWVIFQQSDLTKTVVTDTEKRHSKFRLRLTRYATLLLI